MVLVAEGEPVQFAGDVIGRLQNPYTNLYPPHTPRWMQRQTSVVVLKISIEPLEAIEGRMTFLAADLADHTSLERHASDVASSLVVVVVAATAAATTSKTPRQRLEL